MDRQEQRRRATGVAPRLRLLKTLMEKFCTPEEWHKALED